ncbi:hypothetical protein NDU88_004065 [Pleurodeles waltl]|uniref:Uncharacterized protein n=1 Tax=Pleurodeles waltl TaxID=8319 RepID=A0AAV7TSW8_PLEWA|nr:hypothetical protein NDU88_004065 [Pleurodeles waltl]
MVVRAVVRPRRPRPMLLTWNSSYRSGMRRYNRLRLSVPLQRRRDRKLKFHSLPVTGLPHRIGSQSWAFRSARL